MIACAVADEHGDELFTNYTPYDEEVYDLVEEPSVWYRTMFSKIEDYMLEIMDRTKSIPGFTLVC